MIDSDINKFIGFKNTTVVEAMRLIDNNACGILYIVDDTERLCGCLSDGDIRRWLIRTGNLHGRVIDMMNCTPKYLSNCNKKEAEDFMHASFITSVPVVDENHRIKDVYTLREYGQGKVGALSTALKGIPIIVMAGGKGTRLYPYTKILPKPLIPIGDVPILERILNRFYDYGADEFYITINYKKEMIKSYFCEMNPPYQIHFIEEDKPLGTAGSIHLIDKVFDNPAIVTNCDILIEADYLKLMQYHKESGNVMTIVSSLKNTMIPYGVLHSREEGRIASMEEKPQLSYFINTGMYVVDPEQLKKIPADTVFHMTHLAELLIKENLKVGMYPISEDSFLDMGQFEEMKRMEEKIAKKSE